MVITAVAFGLAGAVGGVAARVLVGRLRRGARVPPPGCELAVAAAWGLTGALWAAGRLPGAWLPPLLALGWLMAALGAVDLARRRLPDALTIPALPAALLLVAPLGGPAVLRGVAGAVLAVAAHAAVRLWSPRSMGAGDLKLAAPLGVVLAAGSFGALLPAVLLAATLTAVGGIAAAAAGWIAPGDGVPHGPSMLLAAWTVTIGTAVQSAAPGLG